MHLEQYSPVDGTGVEQNSPSRLKHTYQRYLKLRAISPANFSGTVFGTA